MLEVLPTATLQPVIATARKLVVIAHLMLKNREPYRYAVPATTRDTTQVRPLARADAKPTQGNAGA